MLKKKKKKKGTNTCLLDIVHVVTVPVEYAIGVSHFFKRMFTKMECTGRLDLAV